MPLNTNNKVSIRTFSRIHISLLDMSAEGYRHNGGLGFFIEKPNLAVVIEKSHSIQVIDHRDAQNNTNFITRTLELWLTAYISKLNITHGFKVIIKGDTPSHYGFGVSTAIRMACVEGINIILDLRMTKEDMIEVSCRGGTSGIGVHGYFSGGLVFDLGHKKEQSVLLPSQSKENNSHNPMLLKTLDMPNWEVGLLIPQNITPKTHDEEIVFFNRTCPIPLNKVYETTYHALFGVLASIQSQDKRMFYQAINAIQKQAWKKAEKDLYPELKEFEKELFSNGAKAVGMSSLGPTLYFFADNVSMVIDKINKTAICEQCKILATSFRNSGREILDD